MKHFVYIIYSKSADKFYVGETHDLEKRLEKHKQSIYKKAYTKIAIDWEILLSQEFENRENAVFIEEFIKRMKSKKFIKKIIKNPSILNEILKRK